MLKNSNIWKYQKKWIGLIAARLVEMWKWGIYQNTIWMLKIQKYVSTKIEIIWDNSSGACWNVKVGYTLKILFEYYNA